MDYALLAATALGAIGLYLMLPRERAPLTRLGLLLGAMALAGFFLFLTKSVGGATGGGDRPPVYFYLFSGIMIAGAVGVVCQPRPVYAALYFVLVTLAGAGLFVLLMAEFMAIVLIIIYAGAILVTYVFVIMLASQGSTGGQVVAPAYDRRASSALPAAVMAFVLVGAILQVLLPTNGRTLAVARATRDPMMSANLGIDAATGRDLPEASAANPDKGSGVAATQGALATAVPSNVQVLGVSLYSHYSLSLELAGVLLTIALIGAVVIARKGAVVDQVLGSGGVPSE
jgi:NADH-quinone oxidoreductase subunit J